ncbi:hypothetical protein Taro_054748 [Colocasia esculenta]|uniref:DUF4219 domain-containing protein/UBN2 domain-containing protein n=1 Tax=Colocasia esculenta TaxID=4460 RepID=A0A843XRB9_COLES|nr:hypothetical protein [Colocasia esculenta]
MDDTYGEGHSINIPPLFDGIDFAYWKTHMEVFLHGQSYDLWNVITKGDVKVTLNEGTSEFSKEDKEKLSLNTRARNILYCAISMKEFNCVSACNTAKEIWDKLPLTHEGTSMVKETKVDILISKYEKFKMAPRETISKLYGRFTDITNGLVALGETLPTYDMIR